MRPTHHPEGLIWPLLMLACAAFTQGHKEAEIVNPELTADTPQMKVYSMIAFDQEFVIELQVVPHQCTYNGVIRGQANSHVTMDTCTAGLLQGEMRTSQYKYTITPMEQLDSASEHFITRDDVQVGDVTESCGYNKMQRIPVETLDEDWSEDEMNATTRERRDAITRKYTIELAVFVTEDFVEQYGNDTERYVMTLLSGANQHFHDPSLGVHISLAVKKIVKLGDIDGVRPDLDGDVMDDIKINFCEWQSVHQWRRNQTDPESYDLSLLLTRKTLKTRAGITLGGQAEMGGVCQFSKACVVVVDRGFPTMDTIAHEFGHTLNLLHDGAPECQALVRPAFMSVNIMSPTSHKLTNIDAPWSRCSQLHIQEFFYSGIGACLKNKPTTYMKFDERLVGEIYSGNEQCQIDLNDPKARMSAPSHLPLGTNLCEELYCHLKLTTGPFVGFTHMKSTEHHRADGTPCGDGHQCYSGNCFPTETIKTPVAGGWAQWTPFSICSKACGGGIKTSERSCTNPTPRYGGKFCRGKQLRYRRCHSKACEDGTTNDRAEQCTRHNGLHTSAADLPSTFNFDTTRWTPVTGANHCKLTCYDETSDQQATMGNVVDGTKCKAKSSNVCVRGVCRRAGCDGKLGSRKKFSKCGICGGSNKKCIKIKNTFRVTSAGVHPIITVPRGAYNFRMEQKRNSKGTHANNYLKLYTAGGRCLINCMDSLTTHPLRFQYGETAVMYSGYTDVETITTEGKALTQELVLQTASFRQSQDTNSISPMFNQKVPWSYWLSTSRKQVSGQ